MRFRFWKSFSFTNLGDFFFYYCLFEKAMKGESNPITVFTSHHRSYCQSQLYCPFSSSGSCRLHHYSILFIFLECPALWTILHTSSLHSLIPPLQSFNPPFFFPRPSFFHMFVFCLSTAGGSLQSVCRRCQLHLTTNLSCRYLHLFPSALWGCITLYHVNGHLSSTVWCSG